MEKSGYTKEQLAQYDKWKIDILSAQSMLDDAEEKGKIEGKMEGKTEIAKKMIIKGIAIEDVSDFTGLSRQQIEELINFL